MKAAPAQLKPENRPRRFLFRLEHPTGNRIHKDRDYSLNLLFPDANETLITALVETLQGPLQNFKLTDCSPVCSRTLADLVRERPLPPGTDEVCLEFTTPLLFPPADSSRPWLLPARQLGGLFSAQVEKLFSTTLPGAPAAWEGIEILSYYWRKESIGAPSRFSEGQWRLVGNIGPLFVRGPLAPIWPLLLLAAEIPLGDAKIGGGSCGLRLQHPFFVAALHNPQTYLAAQTELAERTDIQEEFIHALREPQVVAAEIARSITAGVWQPAPARGFRVPKENGGERLVAVLPPRDYILHKALHSLLAPWLDRAFEPASVGYRPGVPPDVTHARIRAAYRDGRIWALRADIEEFFDQIDWALLAGKISRLLPRADALLAALLAAVVRSPLTVNGVPVTRQRGLLQGSPLSPLLANLFLDGFDEEMERRGLCHVRFADDLLVLCRTEEESKAALATLHALLAPLGLRLNEAKTAILSVDAGFQYLGQTYGGGLDPAAVAEARARRTLYVRDHRAWVGADHDALVVRAGGELLARVPFRRLDGVVLLGAGGASARVVERLDDWGLPLVFCSAGGRPLNTLAPRGRDQFATAATHAARHAALGDAALLLMARRFVHAKLQNHAAWLADLPGPEARETARVIAAALAALPTAPTIDALRGHEGVAARAMFRFLNDRASPAWHSDGRIPHERPDAWNSLLDFSSHLLFSRLLVFALQNGLNPWLGFLHSPLNRYESLVCDLQEPFRPRIERFLLRLVNRRVLQPEDFEPHPRGGVRLQAAAVARFLEQWERELVSRYSGDPADLLDLLEAQVLSLKAWVHGRPELGIYHARLRRSQAAPANPNAAGEPATTAETDASTAATNEVS